MSTAHPQFAVLGINERPMTQPRYPENLSSKAKLVVERFHGDSNSGSTREQLSRLLSELPCSREASTPGGYEGPTKSSADSRPPDNLCKRWTVGRSSCLEKHSSIIQRSEVTHENSIYAAGGPRPRLHLVLGTSPLEVLCGLNTNSRRFRMSLL